MRALLVAAVGVVAGIVLMAGGAMWLGGITTGVFAGGAVGLYLRWTRS